MRANPCTGKKSVSTKPRERDSQRKNGKVRSPMSFAANCVVCWASGKSKRTIWYCSECSLDPDWTYKPRANGWSLAFHPRLCSDACFIKFHTQQIHGLDHHKRVFRRRRSRRTATRTNTNTRNNTRRNRTVTRTTNRSPQHGNINV